MKIVTWVALRSLMKNVPRQRGIDGVPEWLKQKQEQERELERRTRAKVRIEATKGFWREHWLLAATIVLVMLVIVIVAYVILFHDWRILVWLFIGILNGLIISIISGRYRSERNEG